MPWANASNTPLRLYKHYIHEGGISTPLIAAGAGVTQSGGALTKQVWHIIDLMPTCVDAASAKYPASFGGNSIQAMEGHSLMPILRGLERPAPTLFWEHEGKRGIRSGKLKLVTERGKPRELFDIDADRTEQHNLAAVSKSAEEMDSQWQQWAKRCHVLPKPESMPLALR